CRCSRYVRVLRSVPTRRSSDLVGRGVSARGPRLPPGPSVPPGCLAAAVLRCCSGGCSPVRLLRLAPSGPCPVCPGPLLAVHRVAGRQAKKKPPPQRGLFLLS